MTSKPHDAIFKAAFGQSKHASGLLRSILPPSICAAIDWATITPEPGSFVDPDLSDRHSDLLFSVQMSGSWVLIYLLLEHQSTNDHDMILRMLGYLMRICEGYRKEHPKPLPLPLILPVLISHAPGGWTAPTSLHDLFEPHPRSIPGLEPFVPSFSLLIQDLAHVTDDDLKHRALAAFPKLVLWALRDSRKSPESRPESRPDSHGGEPLLEKFAVWREVFLEALHGC